MGEGWASGAASLIVASGLVVAAITPGTTAAAPTIGVTSADLGSEVDCALDPASVVVLPLLDLMILGRTRRGDLARRRWKRNRANKSSSTAAPVATGIGLS